MKQVLIADEQPLTRHSVRGIVEAEGYAVAAECADGREALQQALALRPALVVLDLALPRLGGLEVIRQLRDKAPATRVLVVTAQSSEHFAGLSLQAGSHGFLGKQSTPAELADAIRTVLHGRSYFPARALGGGETTAPRRSEAQQLASLSPRELSVLRYLAMGRGLKQIAAELNIGISSISTYKTRLRQKLNAGSLAEVLEIAWRHQLAGPQLQAPQAAGKAPRVSLEEDFRERYDKVPVAISLRDGEGRLLACNRQFRALHAPHQEVRIGQRIIDNPLLAPENALRYHQNYLQAFAAGTPYDRDLVIHYANRVILLHHHGEPYYDADGQLLGMLCTTADLTGRESQLLALSEAKAQLEANRRANSRLLLALGEDMHGDLARARGMLADPESLADALGTLDSVEARLGALLDLARLVNDEAFLQPVACDLRRFLDELGGREAARLRWATDAAPMVWLDPSACAKLVGGMLLYCRSSDGQVALDINCSERSAAELALTLRAHSPSAGPATGNPETDPRLRLATRLADAMGGELHFAQDASPGATLRLRLVRAQA